MSKLGCIASRKRSAEQISSAKSKRATIFGRPQDDTQKEESLISSKIHDLKGICVAVRVRPLSQKEMGEGIRSCCEAHEAASVVSIRKAAGAKYLKSQAEALNEYAFDAVFDEQSAQTEVYEKTAKPFIPRVVEGFNVTVFAYGATSAGKTHTMFGNTRTDSASANSSEMGIIPNSIADIFRLVDSKRCGSEVGETWEVRVSYIEVYNEQVYDLLGATTDRKVLSLREDQERGLVVIAGVVEQKVESMEEVLRLIEVGNRSRSTESTMANQVSSRSHAVLQVALRHCFRAENGKLTTVESKLSMIDLAGSERASATNNRGVRLHEGANINKSLLALANCINALAENNSGGARKVNVKYRDSKLTLLLKNSLEGKSNLVMIANINPSHLTFEDSHNTLKYANRAKNIKVNPMLKEQSSELSWSQRENMLSTEVQVLKDRVGFLENLVHRLGGGHLLHGNHSDYMSSANTISTRRATGRVITTSNSDTLDQLDSPTINDPEEDLTSVEDEKSRSFSASGPSSFSSSSRSFSASGPSSSSDLDGDISTLDSSASFFSANAGNNDCSCSMIMLQSIANDDSTDRDDNELILADDVNADADASGSSPAKESEALPLDLSSAGVFPPLLSLEQQHISPAISIGNSSISSRLGDIGGMALRRIVGGGVSLKKRPRHSDDDSVHQSSPIISTNTEQQQQQHNHPQEEEKALNEDFSMYSDSGGGGGGSLSSFTMGHQNVIMDALSDDVLAEGLFGCGHDEDEESPPMSHSSSIREPFEYAYPDGRVGDAAAAAAAAAPGAERLVVAEAVQDDEMLLRVVLSKTEDMEPALKLLKKNSKERRRDSFIPRIPVLTRKPSSTAATTANQVSVDASTLAEASTPVKSSSSTTAARGGRGASASVTKSTSAPFTIFSPPEQVQAAQPGAPLATAATAAAGRSVLNDISSMVKNNNGNGSSNKVLNVNSIRRASAANSVAPATTTVIQHQEEQENLSQLANTRIVLPRTTTDTTDTDCCSGSKKPVKVPAAVQPLRNTDVPPAAVVLSVKDRMAAVAAMLDNLPVDLSSSSSFSSSSSSSSSSSTTTTTTATNDLHRRRSMRMSLSLSSGASSMLSHSRDRDLLNESSVSTISTGEKKGNHTTAADNVSIGDKDSKLADSIDIDIDIMGSSTSTIEVLSDHRRMTRARASMCPPPPQVAWQ